MPKKPAQIQAWLAANGHKLDLAAQYAGDEPNAECRPWDTASVRWCLTASWPYEAAAGNQSIPAVYKAIHDHDETFLCDRFYLPATPGDLRLLEKNGLGAFGIESKHPLADFDVVGTSISYPVLTMSFLKLLTMSGIPARWTARDPNTTPMIMVGGLSYGAPEVLAPVVDCWFLGECEDEPGNPGIGAVTARIAAFKTLGRWHTDREACYADLAREFNFLYFPRFVKIHYGYENRPHIGPRPSKQVTGYTSLLDGMRMPFRKRHVKDLDAIKPLDTFPLLYADPAMGSGDVEVARSCPAWSIPVDAQVEVAGRGSVRFDSVQPGDRIRCGSDFYPIAGVALHGKKMTVRVQTRQGHEIECTAEHEIQVIRNTQELADAIKRLRSKRKALDAADREWVSASDLRPGDYVQYFYGHSVWPEFWQPLVDIPTYSVGRPRRDGSRFERNYERPFPVTLSPDVGWFLGAVAGDCTLKNNQVEFRVENHATALAAELRRVGKDLFDLEPTEVPSKFGPSAHLRFNSARLVRWLEENFSITRANSTRLVVPWQIFQSSREVVARYVSAVYDANGTHLAPKTGNSTSTIRFGVNNESFIRQLAELVRLLGLPVSVRALDRHAIKRNGEPSVKWELRSTAADDGEYSWLESLEPFKARFLAEHFRAPLRSGYSVGQDGLVYLQVTGLEGGRLTQVMDVDVPGPEAFNVNGIKVHNCSFCSLSWKSKPYRQRSVPYILDYAKQLQSNMGSTRMAPFSPDLPQYTERRALIAGLLENVSDEVDAPSMRVDDFIADDTFILLQVSGGMDSVSLGVEGNSQRLRDLIGKGTSDNEIKEAVARGIRAGIRKFKLYMIANLPGEDAGDVYRILKLAKDLADIRDSMNQPTVRIQFSWTPLIIEANTPMQWFAPQPADRILNDVWEEFRDLKIDAKLGAKSEENKIAFFQLCQRASRDVGEALVDAMLDVNQACWGGVPRTFKALIESKLHAHGFDNGYADCFDERFRHDMFGWEMIDTGVSTELFWRAYLQMREFAEITDSNTYDLNFGSEYRGAEWIMKCSERCYGKTCGNCDYTDLQHRNDYLRATDRDVDLTTIQPIDQHTQAIRIRARLTKPAQYRFVGNDHWRFLLRRACFRAQDTLNADFSIAKRSIRFASDEVKHRDWTYGTDYAEFALTRQLDDQQLTQYLTHVNTELGDRMSIDGWHRHPLDAVTIRHDVGTIYFSLEVDEHIDTVTERLHAWNNSTEVPMRLKVEGGYFAPTNETVNAKDYVDDLWTHLDGHRLHLRMLIKGRPNPYNIAAALLGTPSWLTYAKHPAKRLDIFLATNPYQHDFLRPSCQHCGRGIPINLLDQPYHPQLCPRCHDETLQPAKELITWTTGASKTPESSPDAS